MAQFAESFLTRLCDASEFNKLGEEALEAGGRNDLEDSARLVSRFI